eukprot:2099895-Alexandrium_andersonii.AAC.1
MRSVPVALRGATPVSYGCHMLSDTQCWGCNERRARARWPRARARRARTRRRGRCTPQGGCLLYTSPSPRD